MSCGYTSVPHLHIIHNWSWLRASHPFLIDRPTSRWRYITPLQNLQHGDELMQKLRSGFAWTVLHVINANRSDFHCGLCIVPLGCLLKYSSAEMLVIISMRIAALWVTRQDVSPASFSHFTIFIILYGNHNQIHSNILFVRPYVFSDPLPLLQWERNLKTQRALWRAKDEHARRARVD